MPLKNSGKTITKIKKYKNKISLYFGDEKLDISYRDYTRFYLYVGKTLCKDEYLVLKQSKQREQLFDYALRLVSKSIYSEYRVREKLYAKDADKGDVDEIIKYLKSNHLIDDKQFIKDFIEECNHKNEGKNKIIAKLLAKGIFRENIDEAFFSYDTELKKATTQINKLNNKYNQSSNKVKRNIIISNLISKGFDEGVAIAATDKIIYHNERDEISNLKKDYEKLFIRLKRKYRGEELNNKIISSLLLKGYKYQDIIKIKGAKR